ncbi:hypothetical protein MKX03_003668 [Papaver bracteatum]|nr:hypothetical protein MKX03_003668 [Papaver bracteatum]
MKEQKIKNEWSQWMNLVISEPYYVYDFIIFFSYLIVRTSAIQIFSSDFSYLLLRREIQAVLALLMLVTVKLVKEESLEGFLSDVFFFSKGFLIVVSLLSDIQLALCYMVVLFVTSDHHPHALSPQYGQLLTSSLYVFFPKQLEHEFDIRMLHNPSLRHLVKYQLSLLNNNSGLNRLMLLD